MTKVWKPHLKVKRFTDTERPFSKGCKANRAKFPYDFKVERVESCRASKCHVCQTNIEPSGTKTLRFALLLQCHKGWKSLCYTHEECFWDHPETSKLEDIEKEVFGFDALDEQTRDHLLDRFLKSKCKDEDVKGEDDEGDVNESANVKREREDGKVEDVNKEEVDVHHGIKKSKIIE